MTPDQAYRHCASLAHSHYENFPVASRALPKRLRRPITAIYAFARTADDLADEGCRPDEERLRELDRLDSYLDAGPQDYVGRDPVLTALGHSVAEHHLPVTLLKDLLSAFRSDVTAQRYRTFDDLQDYCRCSANPIGRLLLHLFGDTDERRLAYSDAVCSALQLINFLQDLREDLNHRNRLYVPQEDMEHFGVSETALVDGQITPEIKDLVLHQGRRAMGLLRAGAPLGSELNGRIGLEIRLVIACGTHILQRKLDAYDEPYLRPRITLSSTPALLWRTLRFSGTA